MEVYLSEEERVDALKRWWKENSRSALTGVILGGAIILGWNAWQNNQRHKTEEASALYQQLLKAVEAKETEPATKLSERLIEQFQGSAYATYATLFLAKLKVDAGDLGAGKKILSDLLGSLQDDNLKHVVRVRLSQALLALGENEAVLKLFEPLKRDQMGKFETIYEELRGDAYAKLGRTAEARVAYQTAKQLGANKPMLELKINDLGSEPVKPAP